MVELFANNGDPDQTPRSVASDLGLIWVCTVAITLLGVSRLQWVNRFSEFSCVFSFSLKLLLCHLYQIECLTLKAPRKTASKNIVCLCHLLNILANLKAIFCIPTNSVDPHQTVPKGA